MKAVGACSGSLLSLLLITIIILVSAQNDTDDNMVPWNDFTRSRHRRGYSSGWKQVQEVVDHSQTIGNDHQHQGVEDPETDALICRVLHVEVYGPKMDGDEDHLECELWSFSSSTTSTTTTSHSNSHTLGHSYGLELIPEIVAVHEDVLRRGEWYVSIPGGVIEEIWIDGYGTMGTKIRIPHPEKVETIPPPDDVQASLAHQRDLLSSPSHTSALGVRTMMVVRVSTNDASPTYSTSQLQTFYFDMSSYSMARQYHDCSSGILQLVPYSTPTMDVHVNGYVSSFRKESLVNAAITVTQNQLNGISLASIVDHVAFILPSGTGGAFWFATGQVGAWRSVYNDKFGGIPNTMMHEVGHNFGLGHAGTPGDQYGDETSIMGYGDYRQFAPSKCFNACDHYNLGWFSDRTVVIDPTQGNQMVTLASFVDYSSTSSNQPVVLKVGNYCLSYNMAKGVNSGTQAAMNQVSVVLSGSYKKSTRINVLDETTNSFQQPNFNGGSQSLVIRVCNRDNTGNVGYAAIAIGMDSASCSSTTTTPPPSPTLPPPDGSAKLRSSPTIKANSNKHPSPSGPTQHSSPRKGMYINAGTNNSYKDASGVVWSGDSYYSGGAVFSTVKSISNTHSDNLYQDQRWAPHQIQYNVPVANGNYQVTLMFAEIRPSIKVKGAREFDVSVEGAVKFQKVDVYATVGRWSAMTLSTTTHVSDGMMTLTLVGRTPLHGPILSGFSLRPI